MGLIVGAIAIGGVVQFIHPKMSDLQDVRDQIEQFSVDRNDGAAPDVDVQARAAHIGNRVRIVHELNQKAIDTRQTYELLRRLAESHGIEFESIQPQESKGSREDTSHVGATTFRLAWVADLTSTGHLLESLDRCGFPHRITNLHMLPIARDDECAVAVSAQVDFLHYPIAPELASMAGLERDDDTLGSTHMTGPKRGANQ